MKKMNHSTGGNIFSQAGKQFAASYKTKYATTIWPSNCIPEFFSHKSLYTNVYSNLIIVAWNWKQLRCPSAGEWVNSVAHSCHRILLRHKMEQASNTPNHLDESPENHTKLKKLQSLKNMQYVIPFIWHSWNINWSTHYWLPEVKEELGEESVGLEKDQKRNLGIGDSGEWPASWL